MILFHLQFWSIVLLDIKFLIDSLPPIWIWVHFILYPVVWMESQLSIYWGAFVCDGSFLWWIIFVCLLPLLRFIFVFDFRSLTTMCLGSFCKYPTRYLMNFLNMWMKFYIRFGKFCHYFLQYFSIPLSFSSLVICICYCPTGL